MAGMIDCTLSQLVLGMACFGVALLGLGVFVEEEVAERGKIKEPSGMVAQQVVLGANNVFS